MIRRPSDFFGRRREVAKIFARIGAARPQSVAVVGDRRIGKSSLLQYVCNPDVRQQHLEHPDEYTFVHVDLQEQREIGVAAFFENVFLGVEEALGRTRPANLPADYEGARRAVLRLQEEGRKVILLFDEFDAITRNPNFPEEFFAFLRALANKYDIAYVTTSGKDLQQLCHAERIADSPFFNIFSNLFLTRFEPEEAAALIAEPSAAAGIPLAAHASEIRDLAGMFPFFMQIACSAFFEELAEGRVVDRDRVRASFLEEAEPHFNYMRGHLDADQRRVLSDVAAGRAVPPSLAYVLNKLRRDGYVIDADGRDRVFSSAFEGFLHDATETLAAPAQQVGSYQIVARLGAGGMGEVFRARDLKLGRDVALKMLPPAVAHDPERLRRLEREARVLAALNHPHIGAIYGFEGAALVLELVEGRTLAELLQGGGLDIGRALSIARQIAEALGAAHDKGIVHRDLKPANIKLTPAGVVKVLDFGLAKALVDADVPTELSSAPTMTLNATREGMIVGTPSYLSPEQARGKAIDKQTDIWAFGCVLYEMLTGRQAFQGDTVSDTIAAILEREPDWRVLPATVPKNVDQLLRACLQKDTARRLGDVVDIGARLDAVAPATWWRRLLARITS